MFKLFKGLLVFLIAALLSLHLLPLDLLLMAGMVLFGLAVAVFILFHLGLRDFQGY